MSWTAAQADEMHRIYQAAKEEWLATHPDPSPLDFRCGYCKAEPYRPCVGDPRIGWTDGVKYHAPRSDKAAWAFNCRGLYSSNAADTAVDEAIRSGALHRL